MKQYGKIQKKLNPALKTERNNHLTKTKTMKLNKVILLIVCLFITAFAYAQEDPTTGHHQHKGKNQNQTDQTSKPTSQDMMVRELDNMVKQLSLSDSQTVQVKDILTNFHQNMDQLMQKKDKSKDDMKMLMDSRDNSLKAVFTDDQWTKYQDMKKQMKNKFDKKPKHNTE